MCGFCGFLINDGVPLDAAPLDAMTASLVHRGPDDGGRFVDGPCALGNRRLAILDLRAEGALPMTRGALTLAYNGEVYNFAAQRRALSAKGYQFSSTGDTEVVLALYCEYGEAFVDHLDGMFAFALWDADRRVLLLGRDAAGKKPMYLYDGPGLLVFGSEIKALLQHPGVPREADRETLHFVMAYGYAPAPRTCFKDLQALEPGVLYRAAPGGSPQAVRSFGVRLQCGGHEELAPEAWVTRILDGLREAIAERTVSDVPLGVFLSGGIDSSLLVALMREQSSGPLHSYSISFGDDPAYDEAAYASQVASRYGTTHRVFEVAAADLREVLPRIVWHHDQPFGDEASLPVMLLAEKAREEITVALCGDGGDELFAGYDYFQHVRTAARQGAGATLMRAASGAGAAALRPLLGRRLAGLGPHAMRAWKACSMCAAPLPEAYYWLLRYTPQPVLKQLWQGDAAVPERWFDAAMGPTRSGDWLDRILDFSYRTYLSDVLLVKADRMSMAASLELRSPFLSDGMVALAGRIPAGLKLRGGQTKWILREAARPYLEESLVRRPKHGFSVPLRRWWREPAMQGWLRELLLAGSSPERGLFSPPGVRGVLEQHFAGAANHGRTLWLLAMCELWHRMFIDPPASRPPRAS